MSVNKKDKQSGFGLVEVLVSITLIIMVMLALHALAQAAFYSWENAQNKSVAYNIIQSTIENLHNKRDTNIVSANTTWLSGLDSTSTPVVTTINNRQYSTAVTVSPVPLTLSSWPTILNDSKRKVVVTVTWKERLGDRSLMGVTYLTDWKSKY